MQKPSASRNAICRFPNSSAEETCGVVSKGSSSSGIAALSVEFAARPQVAHKTQTAIATAITSALQTVTGFAGCLVMVSDQEARLVTVVTLWTGDARFKRRGDEARWVHTLLTPCFDRCLRMQTFVTNLYVPRKIQQGAEAGLESFALQVLTSEAEKLASPS